MTSSAATTVALVDAVLVGLSWIAGAPAVAVAALVLALAVLAAGEALRRRARTA